MNALRLSLLSFITFPSVRKACVTEAEDVNNLDSCDVTHASKGREYVRASGQRES
jgi:hypothetical protein